MDLEMSKFFITNYCIDITRRTGCRAAIATTLTLTEKRAMQSNSLDLRGEKERMVHCSR